jgi:hypothetical protein
MIAVPLDEIRRTREALVGLDGRVDHVDRTLTEGFEKRDRRSRRLVRVIAGAVAVLFAGQVAVAYSFLSYRDAQQTAAREACERGNASAEAQRFQIDENAAGERALTDAKFDDYLLTQQALQSPERRQFLEARRVEQLRQVEARKVESVRRLEELRPIRDCDRL